MPEPKVLVWTPNFTLVARVMVWSASDIDPIPVAEVLDYTPGWTSVLFEGWPDASVIPTEKLFVVESVVDRPLSPRTIGYT